MDDDLAAIRAKRMAELRAGAGAPPGNMPAGMAGMPGMPGMPGTGGAENAEKQKAMEEMRQSMLAQVLTNEARERLNRISIVKAEKARAVEELILQMARRGQLGGKVSEKQLIDMLENIREQASSEPKIIVSRRRDMESDDDEDYGF